MTTNRSKKELNKSIGQHLLVDQDVMDKVVGSVPQSLNVMEIGAGPGLLTKHLAKKSKRVVAVEVDKRFEGDLDQLADQCQNIEIVYSNALDLLVFERFVKFMSRHKEENWIAGNIPYHITEPLIMKLPHLPIQGATFLVGARFANEISADLGSPDFGKLTLLIHTFFKAEIKAYVDKKSFDPPPRTTSAIVVLRARTEKEIASDHNLYLIGELFLAPLRGTKLKNILREALVHYKQYETTGEIKPSAKPIMTKNMARGVVDTLNLSDIILEKSVDQLNNSELSEIVKKIKTLQI